MNKKTLWLYTAIGIIMMVSGFILGPATFFGTFVYWIGAAIFGFAIYYKFKVDPLWEEK